MEDKIFKSIADEPLTVSYVSRVTRDHAVRFLLAVSLSVVCFLSASPAEAAPVIQLMTPQSGPVGTLVAIVGSGFGASQGASTVMFNGTPVTWVSWSTTSLQVQVPAGTASGNVVVTVSGKASNTKNFTVRPPPVITGSSPTSGPVGATIAITGSNFTAGGTQSPQVVFNPELFASPISSTDTSISVAVPAGATTGDILVSVGGGNSNGVLFTVTSSDPSISNLVPSAGLVGTAVTIIGTSFGSSQGTSTVTFNGTTGTPMSWSATSINVPVPTGATTGSVLVTVGAVASNPYGFEVGTAAPNITSISPTSGAVATSVTIKGTGFGSTQGANTVNFNGVSGVPTSWSATQIKVPVPSGATNGSVVVTASGTVSNGVSFTVPGTGPSVSSLSPSSGPVGASVTIAGTNFDVTQGASTVTFNGIAATATGWSPTSIVATVPPGATSGNVVITVGGSASSGFSFTVAPSIASLSPTSGAGGTPITITGTSFGSSQGTSTVTFSGTVATPTSWGASSITVPVPAGAATGNVVVTVAGVAGNGVSFTVPPTPTITSLNPVSGGVGAPVTITGTSFGATQGSSTVTFNGVTATATSWSNTALNATVPAGATTGQIVVTVRGVASNGSSFTLVSAPSITSLSLTTGAVGASVTITGTNFGATQGSGSVSFNGTAATVTNWSVTSIATTVPSGATTGNIVVTAGGVAGNGFSFTVVTLESLFITPRHLSTAAGNALQLTATGTYSDNSTQDLTASVTWTSSESGVATINGSGLATAVGLGRTTLQASVGSIQDSTFLTVSGFALTGSLSTGRNGQTATLLNSGTVLIVGGYDINGYALASTELYNPTTGAFTTTGNLNTARTNHTATLLDDGTVLIAGGFDSSTNLLANTELYNPATGTFTFTGSLGTARANHTAVLLGNGKVLLAGSIDSSGNASAAAELFDPSVGAFIPTGSLNTARGMHTAALLNDGTVLVLSGGSSAGILTSAELYNPVSGTFSLTGSLNTGRVQDTATLMNNSMVLVAGGQDASSNVLASAELYNPASGTFTLTGNLNTARGNHASNLLNSGMVLVEGGFTSAADMSASAELYDPVAGTFSQTGSLNVARQVQTAILLTNGQVLVAGGFSDSLSALSSAELYQPPTLIPANLVSIAVGPRDPPIPAGTAQNFTATGTFSDDSTQSLASATWSSSDASIATVSSDSGNYGVGLGVATGSATVNACTGPVCGSTIVTVIPNNASITSLSASSGPIGSSLTITGTSLGSIQGKSAITFNGTPGFPTGWSNTQVVVAVPTGATTGNVVLTIAGVPINGINFTVVAGGAPAIISLSPTMAPTRSVVLVEGTNFGSTQESSTLTFNGTPVAPVLWSDSDIILSLPSSLSPGVQSVVVTTFSGASPPAQFTVESLTISSISPSAAAIGAQVTINGAGFGPSQARTGFVVFNGVAATPTNWTDSQIISPVPNGASSGNVQLVTFDGAYTAGVNFTVISAIPSAPTISASPFPLPNPGGWNNTNVTVTFTCMPGSAVIASCTSPRTLSTEGANQVVSGTVTDSAGASATTSVTVNLDKTPPALIIASPSDGAIFTASSVAVSGTASDSLSGLASVSCNGTVVSVTNGGFSCNISLNAGVNLLVARATDVAGNVAASIMHLTLNTTLPAPTSLQISPQGVNMVAGETHSFSAVDQNHIPRTDATWTVSNTSLATISGNSSPVLTAIALGQVTLTATVQGLAAQETVNILNVSVILPGAARWTASPIPGLSCVNIVQAVPTTTATPDFYCVATDNNGNIVVQALTSDGMLLWQKSVATNASLYDALPDANGGLIVDLVMGPQNDQSERLDLDGLTGSVVWQTQSNTTAEIGSALRQDGSIATVLSATGNSISMAGATSYFNVLGGTTGATISSFPLPPISNICPYNSGAQTTYVGPFTAGPVVDSNGTTFLLYETGYTFEEGSNCPHGNAPDPAAPGGSSLNLVQVSADGSSSTQVLSPGLAYPLLTSTLIPDDEGGIIFVTANSSLGSEYQINHYSTSSSTLSAFSLPYLTGSTSRLSLVRGENGMVFATDSLTAIAIDINSGQVPWNYSALSPNTFTIATSAAGNSLVGKVTDQNGIDTALMIDPVGTVSSSPWSAASLQYYLGSSWLGIIGGAVQGILGNEIKFPASTWNSPSQKQTNASSRKIQLTVLKINEAYIDDAFIQARIATATNYWQAKGLLFNWNNTPIGIPACDPTLVGCGPTSDQYLSSIQSPATLGEVYRRFIYDPNANKGAGLVKVAPTGITVLFANLLPCVAPADTSAYALPNAIPLLTPNVPALSGRGYTLNFVLAAHRSCTFVYSPSTDKSDDVLDHEFGHVLQLDHVGIDNLTVLGILDFAPLVPATLPVILLTPASNLMCGFVGQSDELQNLLQLCGISRQTRYLTEGQHRSAVGWGKAVLSAPIN
jgi:hypothetical protein